MKIKLKEWEDDKSFHKRQAEKRKTIKLQIEKAEIELDHRIQKVSSMFNLEYDAIKKLAKPTPIVNNRKVFELLFKEISKNGKLFDFTSLDYASSEEEILSYGITMKDFNLYNKLVTALNRVTSIYEKIQKAKYNFGRVTYMKRKR